MKSIFPATALCAVIFLCGPGDATKPLHAQSVSPGRCAGSMAAADFDEDGLPDLVCGSAEQSGGVNIFAGLASAPQWFGPGKAFASASLTGTGILLPGDFNADGHLDLLTANYGNGPVTILLGDGKGGVASARELRVPGAITAAAYGDVNRPDGLADFVLAVTRDDESKVLVYESPAGAMTADPEVIPVKGPVKAISIGRLDDDDAWADIAVATDSEVEIIFGRNRIGEDRKDATDSAANIKSVPLPFQVSSITRGDFLPASGAELAFLSSEGVLSILSKSHAGWNWSAYPVIQGLELLKCRISGKPQDDLLLSGPDGRLYAWNASRPDEMRLLADTLPVVEIALRLNRDALDDLVTVDGLGEIDFILSSPSAVFTVDSDLDDPDNTVGDGVCLTAGGVCTLRAAIQEANASAGVDSIAFAIPVSPSTVPVISPASPLPAITEAVTIDGTTQAAGMVHLSGSVLASGAGLEVTSGSSTIRGMVITQFAYGIRLEVAGSNIIEGNLIGLDPSGAVAMGNTYNGIRIESGNNIIGGTAPAARNVISANGALSPFDADGVFVNFGASGNQILGNYIGTDAAGTSPLGNLQDGVGIAGMNTTVGGNSAGAASVISGNQMGVAIGVGDGVILNGNLIGTDPSGSISVPNTVGVGVFGSYAIVGGIAPSSRNVISGNTIGIVIEDGLFEAAEWSLVMGNFIGLNAAGNAALGNAGEGVLLGASGVFIGYAFPGSGNVISGNQTGIGIGEAGLTANYNRIQRNYIGTDPSGTAQLGNQFSGIRIDFGATGTLIGDESSGGGNVISGNGTGIELASSFETRILGNRIGVDVTGTLPLGNVFGIEDFGSSNTTIGAPGGGNVISANSSRAIHLMAPTSNTTIQSNLIGTDVTGTQLLGNFAGIDDGGSFTVIGGPGAGNVISGCFLPAIQGGYIVQGNLIGTDITGTVALGNGEYGISGARFVGGDRPGEGNVVSGNFFGGISVFDPSGGWVKGNFVGTDITGTANLGNGGTGIAVSGAGFQIGGLDPGAGNRVAFNADGIGVYGTAIAVLGNNIYANNGLGIDLGNDGVTPNDPGDSDTGPNNLQNFPVLTSASTSGSNTIVTGALNSTASTQFTIELFSDSTCDSSQHGEGETHIGITTLATDASGNADFTIPLAALPAGSFVTATATDANGNTSEFSECVQIVSCPAITISPASLPPGTAGSGYSQTLTASGGASPYTMSVSSGLLPPGLTLNNATGEISGTPTGLGTFNFVVTAQDSNSCAGSAAYSIAITCGSITISPATLPDGATGTSYNATVSAAGGNAPYTYAVAGSLPPGRALNSATGEISGTPTSAGAFPFAITATDASGCVAVQAYTITIASSCPPIGISPSTLPAGTAGSGYSQMLTASGGTSPYTMSVTSGLLPPGLTLNGASGEISGTPAALGTFNFVVTAQDSNSCTGSAPYSIVITCGSISMNPATLPDGVTGTSYSATVSATGGNAPYTFAVAGTLPSSLSLDPATGEIAGTPTDAGAFPFAITATDAGGCVGVKAYSINIVPSCLYCDDFDDGMLSTQWTYLKPSWTEPAGGRLIGSPASKKAVALATPAFIGCSACTVEARFTSAGGLSNKVSLLAWYQDKNNYVELLMKEENDKWILKERINGRVVAKASGISIINPGQFYDAIVGFDGVQFTVSIDGAPLFSMPAHGAHTGTAGFQVKNTIGSFDNILVN